MTIKQHQHIDTIIDFAGLVHDLGAIKAAYMLKRYDHAVYVELVKAFSVLPTEQLPSLLQE